MPLGGKQYPVFDVIIYPRGSTMTIKMKKEKDCKGSVKYSTDDAKAVVTNVYVDRSFASPMPDTITITVGEGGGSSKKSKKQKEEPAEGE